MRGCALFVLLIISYQALCQDTLQLIQPNRYEKERKFSDEEFTIIPLKEEGLGLIREKNKYKAGNKSWELIILDTLLEERNSFELEIDQRKNLIGYENSPGALQLLFKSGESLKLSLDLISIQLATGETSRYEINPELNFQLTHFIRVDRNFIFGGYVNNEPAILLYNPASDNLKVLPGFFQKQTELIDLRPNINNTFNIVLVDRGDRIQQKMVVKTFDATGIELLMDEIPIEDNYSLQTGLTSMLQREDMSVIGTWGSRNSKQSLGFFAVPVNPFTDQKIKFTALGEMNHYTDYLNPKRSKRIKDRTKEALQARKLPDFANYIMPYKIVEHPEGFILLAEVYNPSASFNRFPTPYPYDYTYPFYSPYWGFYPRTYNRLYNPYSFYNPNNAPMRNSDEIKTTQSVIAAFDSGGNIRWDFSVELDNMRTTVQEQIADFCVVRNKVFAVYKKESDLIIKSINLDTEKERETTEKILLPNPGDEVRSETNAGAVRHWYGKNFYVWGQHTIKNRTSREEGRNVFYINKLVVNY